MLKKVFMALFLWPSLVYSQYEITETHFLESETEAAHASTILEVKNGEILASWFAGKYEGHQDVGIYLARYKNGKWSTGKEVAKAETINGKTYPCWNPVLIKNASNKIFLYYKVGPNPREWWGKVITSNDNGKTWSKPQSLPDGFLGPIRVKSFTLRDGKFLHPSSTETVDTDYWSMHFEISDKNGKNWEKVNVDCDTFQVIQPTLILLPQNRLKMMARSRHNKIISSYSDDFGKTWSPLYAMNLPNPNSGIDATNTVNGDYLMVYNPLNAGKDWWDGRSKIVLGESKDGENWTEILPLEDHEKGEFSYPAIIQTSDGKIHITYTFDRKKIKHLVLRKI